MKKNAPKFLVIALGLSTLMVTTSCNKDEDEAIVIESSESEISEEEAVEIIEASLQAETGGLTETTKSTCEELDTEEDLESSCDVLYENTYPFSYDGPLVQASYTVIRSFEIACNGANVPQTAESTTETTGTYTTTTMSSNDTTASQLSISGLQPGATAYLVSGSYEREGTQTITLNQSSRDLSSTLSANLSNLVIDKSDYRIDSGEGTVELTTVNLNNVVTFEGSIVFNGNGEATLTLNGNTYIIVVN